MSDTAPILVFDSITTGIDPWYDTSVENFSLALKPGELGLIRFDRHAPRGPLPDAAMGLIELTAGEICFLGESWTSLSANVASQRRGQIGRLFAERGWVHHLDVDENITLRQRHHTRRAVAEIETEAEAIARAMGLRGGLPRVRPAHVDPRDLQRAAGVRMLLGSPPLLVVDEPPSGLYAEVFDALNEQVNTARGAGAAVLWLSADPAVWASLQPTFRVDCLSGLRE
jgi:phospholipid/cholesterol/gamma-HCH transport system ATP-binding protein